MPDAAGLWYEWTGNADGEPLLLSSGLGGSASYWQPNLAALGERYRILLYDHRGTGRSDRALPDRVSVDDLADDILTVLDASGTRRAHLIGHAAGGVAGLALAMRAPERLASLVMVNGWASPDPHFARCFDARLALLRNSGPEAYLRAQPIFLYPAPWISAHHEELEAELAHQFAGFAGAGNFEKRIAALRSFDVRGQLGEIDVPTLLVSTADDMLVPWTCSTKLAAEFRKRPPSQLHFAWGGHACNVTDAPGFDAGVLDFLNQHPIKG